MGPYGPLWAHMGPMGPYGAPGVKNKKIFFLKIFIKKYFGYKRVLDRFWARMDAGFEISVKKDVY